MRIWTIILLTVFLISCTKSSCSVDPGIDADIDVDSENKTNIDLKPKADLVCSF